MTDYKLLEEIKKLSEEIGDIGRQIINLSADVSKVSESTKDVNKTLLKLNVNIEEASNSSGKLTRALNRITLWGIVITGAGVFFAFFKFLYRGL